MDSLTAHRRIARLGVLIPLLAASLLTGFPAAHALAAPGPTSPATDARAPAAISPASLTDGLDALPVMVDDPGSPDARPGLAAYRSTTLRDVGPLSETFVASFDALVAAGGDHGPVDALRDLFIEDPQAMSSGDAAATVRQALGSIAGDPRNADLLNNAAVAAWLHGVVIGSADFDSDSWHLQQAATIVLHEANETFPGTRSILLNLAFLTTTAPGWQFSGAGFAAEALALDPSDLTARALLASIQSRRADTTDGAIQAEAILQPIVTDPAHAALGHALVGDAHLAAAAIRKAEAPAGAKSDAALAIAAYGRAIGLSADPGLQAGMARALEIQGDVAAAAAAQARAVDLAPDSLDWLVDLARIRHRAGDVDGLRAAAASSVAMVTDGWDPAIAGVRFVTAPGDDPLPEDRGFLGWSVGSATDHLPVPPNRDSGDGGAVVVVATIPLEPPGIDHALIAGFAPRSAWQLALSGAILAADEPAANQLAATWDQAVPWDANWDEWLDAAHDVAVGPPPPEPVDPEFESDPRRPALAETVLRRAHQFDRAADLCLAFGDMGCAGENRYHAGHAAAALTDLRSAFDAAEARSKPPSSELRMVLAAASEAVGDMATAEAFLATTAGSDDADGWRALAALRTGDLRLDAGDPSGAIAWYDLALATIDANGLAEVRDYHEDTARALEFRGLRQVARNNRAVARLRSLQPNDESPPACVGAGPLARCEAALGDIRAAVASDPANAAYRMNAGWAGRLLGHAEEARAALAEAVRLDPALYPAFNDLGILLAEAGDVDGARRAFTAAIAASPEYDLAPWNLGILALRDVPGGLLEGQIRLADALRLDPGLRTAALAFRTDERTYRFGFEAPLATGDGAALGRTYSIGAVVLATFASIAALAQLQATIFGHGVQTAVDGTGRWLESRVRGRGWRSRRRAIRRRLPRPIGGPWLPWVGVAALLLPATSWQAAQASPATAGAAIAMALIATVVALVAHATGHLIAARAVAGRLLPAAWGPGAIVAILFLPIHAATGPFLAERIRLANGGQHGAWRFHIAGPLANAVVGLAAYGLFLIEPMPGLRLLAQVQLATIAYTLLPSRPLDGWALQRQQPRLLLGLGFAVVAAGAAFALGIL